MRLYFKKFQTVKAHTSIRSADLNFGGLWNQYRENCTLFFLLFRSSAAKPAELRALPWNNHVCLSLPHTLFLQSSVQFTACVSLANYFLSNLAGSFSPEPMLAVLIHLSPLSIFLLITPMVACLQQWKAEIPRCSCRWASSGSGHRWKREKRRIRNRGREKRAVYLRKKNPLYKVPKECNGIEG